MLTATITACLGCHRRDDGAAQSKPMKGRTAIMQLDPDISVEQRYWWRIALELRLRKCNGDAFQEFFSAVMAQLHGDDFVRVRPFGKLGDKGCDGYLNSVGQLFQCYGAMNGAPRVRIVVAPIETENWG